ncbi:class I SAM-dependent methyltransferase [Salinarimonas soli]|uniref:class I SAM-dependent methyltransferase n=1 Tax=Salinarimonas soli TaxID=1638099 RepID=UPI0016620093|nr:class I SAM-dependent methyltransferase [Salinarimonas soli]
MDEALRNAPSEPLAAVSNLMDREPGAWHVVRTVIDAVAHEAPHDDPVAHWARLFDNAVQASPEGSVALYSLGNPSLLATATDEIVGRMRDWELIGPNRAVLDVGCGIGRLGARLAPHVGEIIGLDISPGMIAEAERRCAAVPNLRFAVSGGRDLAGIGTRTMDLVVFVDSFPYLQLSGEDLAGGHVAEAARVLRPAGAVLILNASYGRSIPEDRADLARFAQAAGLVLKRVEKRPFQTWDAPAFVLAEP